MLPKLAQSPSATFYQLVCRKSTPAIDRLIDRANILDTGNLRPSSQQLMTLFVRRRRTLECGGPPSRGDEAATAESPRRRFHRPRSSRRTRVRRSATSQSGVIATALQSGCRRALNRGTPGSDAINRYGEIPTSPGPERQRARRFCSCCIRTGPCAALKDDENRNWAGNWYDVPRRERQAPGPCSRDPGRA